jgi:hypothetical protein
MFKKIPNPEADELAGKASLCPPHGLFRARPTALASIPEKWWHQHFNQSA